MADGPWYDGAEQRRRRRAAGLSITDLAEQTGSSLAHLSTIETSAETDAQPPRQPSPGLAKKIAESLGCTVPDLMHARTVVAS